MTSVELLAFNNPPAYPSIVEDLQMPNPPIPTALLQGTLDLLILKTLSLSPMHGWGNCPPNPANFG